jgi:hypothetical protein
VSAACAASLILLAACSDEPGSETPPPPAPSVEAKIAIHSIKWLRQTDHLAPEQWLASRQAGHDLDANDPAVDSMRHTLEVAATRFRDHPRMIANRAVQLHAMLTEKHIEEDVPSIIRTLCEVPGNTRNVESFASLTQQYYNLRINGVDKAQAILALRMQNDPDH